MADKKIAIPAGALCFSNHEPGSVELMEVMGAEKDAPTRFRIVANSGRPFDHWLFGKLMIDFDKMTMRKRPLDVLREHDTQLIAGKGDLTGDGDNVPLVIEGTFSKITDTAREIIALEKEARRFEASVRVSPKKVEFLKEGEKAKVNGQDVTGPMAILRGNRLDEVSFCLFGADKNTSGRLVAGEAENIICESEGQVPGHLINAGQGNNIKEYDIMSDKNKKTADDAQPVVEAKEPAAAAPSPPAEPAASFGQADIDRARAVGLGEGHQAGSAEGFIEGAKAERARITSIRKLALPGQEAFAEQLIEAGGSVDEAKDKFLEAARKEKSSALAELERTSPPSANSLSADTGVSQFSDAGGDDKTVKPESELRKQFADDPDRGDFLKMAAGDDEKAFASYQAYQRAASKGLIRIKG